MPGAPRIDLLLDRAVFGAARPKAGSNDDYAVVKLAEPVRGAAPFPVTDAPVKAGDRLIVVTAHPAGMEKVDNDVPVVQECAVRRVPRSTARTSFYRSDCDATGASSGGMNLARVGGDIGFALRDLNMPEPVLGIQESPGIGRGARGLGHQANAPTTCSIFCFSVATVNGLTR